MRRTKSREPECQSTLGCQRIEISMVSLAGFPTSTSDSRRTTIRCTPHIENSLIALRIITTSSTMHLWRTRSSSARMPLKDQSLVYPLVMRPTLLYILLSASNHCSLPRCVISVRRLLTWTSRVATTPHHSTWKRTDQTDTLSSVTSSAPLARVPRFPSFALKSTRCSYRRPTRATPSSKLHKRLLLQVPSEIRCKGCAVWLAKNRAGTTISSLSLSSTRKCTPLRGFLSSRSDPAFLM